MKNIFSKILLFSALFIVISGFGDWYIEKIITNSTHEGMEKVWIKGDFYKSKSNQYSVVYNSKTDSLRYENHHLRSYWAGSFAEWKAEIDSKKPIHSQSKDKKRSKKKSSKAKTIVLIKPMNDSLEIAGLMGQKYIVIVNGEPKEEFFFYRRSIYKEQTFNRINQIKDAFQVAKTKYRQTKDYVDFIKKGLVLKRIIMNKDGLFMDDMEMMTINSEEIDPTVFNVPDNYQPLPLEQLLNAQKFTEEPQIRK